MSHSQSRPIDRLLTEDQIREIHLATLEILDTVGMGTTGKPVVPINHTHLRPWAPKRSRLREARYGGRRKVGAQAPRLRWVIRR